MIAKNKKKRLVFFLPNFSLGGASESIFKLVNFLVKFNFSILIISIGKNYYKKVFKKMNCEIIELKSTRVLFAISKIRKIMINETKKDFAKIIFISNINYANIISIISLLNLKKIRIILTERSSISELKYFNNLTKYFKNKLLYLLAKYFYKFSDLVITNSIFERNYIQEEFNLKNVICIHPPSIKKILKLSKTKLYNNDRKKKKIIFVGRLSKEKGIYTILKALAKIDKKYKFIFYLFGDGPEKRGLKEFIKILNMNNHVIFKGFIKNKSLIFKDASLFINASLWEGLPNALVQSINYGVFPICSASPGGNIEVINYGKFGMSFKTENVKDLQKKLLIFFVKKLKLIHKGRQEHLKKYTEKSSNKKYLEILNKL